MFDVAWRADRKHPVIAESGSAVNDRILSAH